MSSLLQGYYKWRLKTPKERVMKFQEKANALLQRYGAKIYCSVELKCDKDEKKVRDRFEKLKEDFGIQIKGNLELIPEKWDNEPEKVDEK